MTQATVLLVDDEDHILKAIGTYLERRGYEVMLAKDGEEAMQAVAQRLPDVVISDVMMPRMDGFELTRRLRAHPRTASIPILILSARKQEAALLEGYSAGADEYVAKPVQLSVLAAKLDALVRRRPPVAVGPKLPGRVITFVHAKGGVGTTTLLVNAAASAERSPELTYVIDAASPMGDVSVLLDLTPARSIADLVDLTTAIDQAALGQVTTTHSTGLKVLSAPASLVDAERVNGTTVRAAIVAASASADFVYVDTECALSDRSIAGIDGADVICVVTTPGISSIRATRQLLGVLERMDIPASRIHVVLNRTTPHGADDGQIAHVLGLKRLAVVPYSELFVAAGDEGRPLVLARPESSAAAAIRELAEALRSAELPLDTGDRAEKLIA